MNHRAPTPLVSKRPKRFYRCLSAQVKARIEKTSLSDICDSVTFIANGDEQKYVIKLSCTHINLLQLKVSAQSVKYSIVTSKLKVSDPWQMVAVTRGRWWRWHVADGGGDTWQMMPVTRGRWCQ